MDDPTAPLGHHWIDATHISFGVLTAGLFTRRIKLEGSILNGREPDVAATPVIGLGSLARVQAVLDRTRVGA
jgi:hypothetical protein